MKKQIIILGIITIVPIAWYIREYRFPPCIDGEQYKTVYRIGGCDRDGYCGILLTDGTTDVVYFPVAGQKIPYQCAE